MSCGLEGKARLGAVDTGGRGRMSEPRMHIDVFMSMYVHVHRLRLFEVQKVNGAIWSVRACGRMCASMHASPACLGWVQKVSRATALWILL